MVSSLVVVFVLVSIITPALVHAAAAGASCSIQLNGDLPNRKQPLYLEKSGSSYVLVTPEVKNRKGVIELDKNESLILACPGKNNYLMTTKKSTTASQCVSDTTLAISNSSKTTFSVKDAECATAVQADVKATNTRCQQVGKLYEIGFNAEGWQLMITVCHEGSSSNTLYSNHQVKGKALEGAEQESDRPRFQEGLSDELYPSYNPDNYYKKKNQETLFKDVFGATKAKFYFTANGDFFLSRGHLAPDGDFIFGSEQFATYFYINVAPQWQTINAGNWLTVEKMVRKYATKIKADLTVVTGTHGILELPDGKEKTQKLYLNNQKKGIPVPLYFWKVVYNPATKQGIAFTTSNNPYLKADSKIPFCKNACENDNWSWSNSNTQFTNVTRGLTSCCSVNDLRTEISHVPYLDVNAILRGS